MEERICIGCNKPFVVVTKSARYCGHSCAARAMNARRRQPVVEHEVPESLKVQGKRERYYGDASGQWWYRTGKYNLRADVRECGWCHESFLSYRNWGALKERHTVYCSRACGLKASYQRMPEGERRYDNARAYKGGRQYRQGYVFVLVGADHPGVQGTKKRYLPEHRLVMEQVLGRPLTRVEQVHHKNGIRDDNRPENLELWIGHQPVGQRAHEQKHCPTCTCGVKH